MEINCSSSKHFKNGGILACIFASLMSFPRKLRSKLANFAKVATKLAKEDPRRVVHPIKVGMALTLVSLFYYLHPLYSSLGVSAIWAVLTVIVVFEFSVGGTIGKGTNRMVATCLAGGLAVGAHYLANLSGNNGEPIILLLFGFLVAVVMTFMRFFPKLKARYDYGLMIFILTFALVAVSGYRGDEVFLIALNRLKTIVIGCCITILVCVFVCPVWSGAELHNLISSNIDKLGTFLEVFGGEFFQVSDHDMKGEGNKSLLFKYKSVLTTKGSEDIMANQARWEPGHGKFRYQHPWKQYLKIGALTRQCAYKMDALTSYLDLDSQVINQTNAAEVADSFKETCMRLSSETGKALKELSHGMKKMKRTSLFMKARLKESKSAADELKSLLETTGFPEGFNLLELLPMATVASLLIEIVTCTEQIAESVDELAALARFKAVEGAVVSVEDPSVKVREDSAEHVVVLIDESQVTTNEEVNKEVHEQGIAIACSEMID